MRPTTDVRLPRNRTAKYPDRCVVCGHEHPDGTVCISTRAIGWWRWFHWLPGRKLAVEVPACSLCGRQLGRQYHYRWLAAIALTAGTVLLMMLILGDISGPISPWIGLAVVFVVLSTYDVLQSLFPPPLELMVYSRSVNYEFRDRTYAVEFAALNNAETTDRTKWKERMDEENIG